MTTKERIMAIRLSESIQRQRKYAAAIGVIMPVMPDVTTESAAENPAEQKEVIKTRK